MSTSKRFGACRVSLKKILETAPKHGASWSYGLDRNVPKRDSARNRTRCVRLIKETALRDYSSGMISRYIDAFKIKARIDQKGRYVEIDAEAQRQVKTLKMLTWYYVIYDVSLTTQRLMISSLFITFLEAVTDRTPYRNIFPQRFAEIWMKRKTIRKMSQESLRPPLQSH